MPKKWSFTGDYLMIKSVYKKQTKSPFTIIVYFVLMALSFFLLECSTYDVLRVSGY